MYEEFVNAPDTHIGDSPINRLDEQVAADTINFDWNAPRSDRMLTNQQAHMRLYKHHFTRQHDLRRPHELFPYCVPLVCPCICLVEPAAGL